MSKLEVTVYVQKYIRDADKYSKAFLHVSVWMVAYCKCLVRTTKKHIHVQQSHCTDHPINAVVFIQLR